MMLGKVKCFELLSFLMRLYWFKYVIMFFYSVLLCSTIDFAIEIVWAYFV